MVQRMLQSSFMKLLENENGRQPNYCINLTRTALRLQLSSPELLSLFVIVQFRVK